MTRTLVCLLAASAVSVSSQAVGGVGLDLTLIGRNTGASGVLPWSAVSNAISVNNATATQTVRLEVRFALHDSIPNDNINYAGLCGSAFDIRSTFPAASGATINFARILTADNNDGAPARDGVVTTATIAGIGQGLPNAYRPNPGNNGRLGTAPDGNLGTLQDYPVIPLSIETPSNTPVDGARYQLFVFNIAIPTTVAAGTYSVRLANIDQSGIFYGVTDDGTELGVLPFDTSFSSLSSVNVTVVPAPGAAALLGLGGLMAARRRRN